MVGDTETEGSRALDNKASRKEVQWGEADTSEGAQVAGEATVGLPDSDPAPGPEKTKAQRSLAKPLKVLVGRVGIEPTTNGLRVQDICALGAKRKPWRRNGGFAGTDYPPPRDRTYA